MKTDWIVMSAEVQGFKCQRCGAIEGCKFPISIKDMKKQSDTFINAHKDCKATSTEPKAQ